MGRGGRVESTFGGRSLNLGPFSSELSMTVSRKAFFFFCNQLLIWEMRNGLKIVLKLSSSVNFP